MCVYTVYIQLYTPYIYPIYTMTSTHHKRRVYAGVSTVYTLYIYPMGVYTVYIPVYIYRVYTVYTLTPRIHSVYTQCLYVEVLCLC